MPRRGCDVIADPEHAELAELARGQRVGGARIAPRHVPGVLEEDAAHVLFADLLGEHRFVEVAELVFREHGKVHAGRELDRAVVRRLDPPVARERVENEILRSVGVDGAEPDGEHELGRFERDLKWPQGC